jgi:hypothetical protein
MHSRRGDTTSYTGAATRRAAAGRGRGGARTCLQVAGRQAQEAGPDHGNQWPHDHLVSRAPVVVCALRARTQVAVLGNGKASYSDAQPHFASGGSSGLPAHGVRMQVWCSEPHCTRPDLSVDRPESRARAKRQAYENKTETVTGAVTVGHQLHHNPACLFNRGAYNAQHGSVC